MTLSLLFARYLKPLPAQLAERVEGKRGQTNQVDPG
jgi:hypothetical protein